MANDHGKVVSLSRLRYLEKEGFMREMTEEVFLKDVSTHAMEVLKDDGVYRHLRFASKGEHPWNQWFAIVTWPGYLAFSGDMGCFVFSRLWDMFTFFRTDRRDSGKLNINLGYWSEKLEAVDSNGRHGSGATEFSAAKFKALVDEHVNQWIEDFDEEIASQRQVFAAGLRAAIEVDVLHFADDGEQVAHEVLRDFSCKINGQKFEFSDTWEWDLKDYTLRFVWCCYAIAWAIKQYDESKAEPIQEQVA